MAALRRVSSSVLSQRLGELTEAGIVQRAERGYVLTADGEDLAEEFLRLSHWADRWATHLKEHAGPNWPTSWPSVPFGWRHVGRGDSVAVWKRRVTRPLFDQRFSIRSTRGRLAGMPLNLKRLRLAPVEPP
ncbi:hypothetical protein GCM10023085_24630 [Actinomadura viridis]|uniref:winged helix-turn-helix transcriptional regulator n=1 Tax=Actinomadura viridis TaxID=58110 RepID=UPI0018CA0FE2